MVSGLSGTVRTAAACGRRCVASVRPSL